MTTAIDLVGRPPIMKRCKGYPQPERPAFRREGSKVLVPHITTQATQGRTNSPVTIQPAPWEAAE